MTGLQQLYWDIYNVDYQLGFSTFFIDEDNKKIAQQHLFLARKWIEKMLEGEVGEQPKPKSIIFPIEEIESIQYAHHQLYKHNPTDISYISIQQHLQEAIFYLQ